VKEPTCEENEMAYQTIGGGDAVDDHYPGSA